MQQWDLAANGVSTVVPYGIALPLIDVLFSSPAGCYFLIVRY